MYQTSDIRNGLKVEIDGQPYVVTYFQFVKPGKGQAFTRTKLKNLLSGNVLDRTFKTGETLQPADITEGTHQFLYADGESFHFMNMETYDQLALQPEAVGDAKNFLVEEMEVNLMFYRARPVSVDLPNFVELEITYCEPGVKGNTAQGATKPATLSTGHTVNVPLFIEQGEWVKVDTRTGDYVERVRK
ncbi:MAG: elongation factor P [Myxococcales bacterium]|nr:elongation factor P [Myxococcales bacterium]